MALVQELDIPHHVEALKAQFLNVHPGKGFQFLYKCFPQYFHHVQIYPYTGSFIRTVIYISHLNLSRKVKIVA